MDTEIATSNLCQQDAVFLQAAQARAKTQDVIRLKYLKIPFDTVSQFSFIAPRVKGY